MPPRPFPSPPCPLLRVSPPPWIALLLLATRPPPHSSSRPSTLNFSGGMHISSSVSSGGDAAAAERAIEEFTTSSLRTQDEVDALCRRHGVVLSKGFKVSPAEEDRNVSSAPPAGAVCVHVHALEAGLCYKPRQQFINAVLTHSGIAPSQLAPNSWRTMAGFVGLCHSLGVEPSVAVFRYFFRLWPLQYKGESRYFFRNKIKNRAVFSNMPSPSTTCNWKKSFFLVWSPVSWACPVVWSKPSESSLADWDLTQLTIAEISAQRKLFDTVDRCGPLDINQFFHLYDENDHGSASSSAMTPPAPSPRTNAQGADVAADAVVDTTISAEKGTAVEASAAPGILALPGKKRNREEVHTEGPLRLDLRRVSLPDFSAPNVNADDQEPTSMDQSPILLGGKEKAPVLELLYTAMNADAIREEEMEKTKAQLSEANDVAKLEKENADALREELKMVKAQLSKANEAAKLEKENAQGLRKLMLLGRN